MKGIWKIFEFENYDILMTRDAEEENHKLTFTVCLSPGNSATYGIGMGSAEEVEKAFAKADPESVMKILKPVINMLGGESIFSKPTSTSPSNPTS